MDWKQEAIQLHAKYGRQWAKIADDMIQYFPGASHSEVREKIRKYIRGAEKWGAAGIAIKQEKPEKPPKVEVVQNLEPSIKTVDWKGDKIIRFGLMGDTQINSKYTQLTYLHQYYDECEREGITDVYHTGDIDEGDQMRMGHQYECYHQGADEHVDEIVRVYPKRNGMTTHFITGNHDASITKRSGHDIGKSIAEKRPDMEYLGADCAIIHLTPNCTLELRHPWDGTAYAISYKIQKMIEAMSGGEKPNILAVGHYHKMEDIFYRNVHAYQTGCFQAQTPFMRGKGIAAMMGGWIIEIHVDGEGHISKLINQKIPLYVAIKDDYKNWANYG